MDTIRFCHYCRTPLHTVPANETHFGPPIGRVWVDATDGDCCSGDDGLANENLPHVPAHVWIVLVTAVPNPEDDSPSSEGDDPINFLSVYGDEATAKASALEQFDDMIAENDDFDDGDEGGLGTNHWSHRDGVSYTVTDSFSIRRIEVIRRDIEVSGQQEERQAMSEWWLCPNGQCPHGAVLHDSEDWDDPAPTCCVEGCICPRPAADGVVAQSIPGVDYELAGCPMCGGTDDPANHAECLKKLNDDPYPEPRWGQDGL